MVALLALVPASLCLCTAPVCCGEGMLAFQLLAWLLVNPSAHWHGSSRLPLPLGRSLRVAAALVEAMECLASNAVECWRETRASGALTFAIMSGPLFPGVDFLRR